MDMDPAERGGVEWVSEFCPVKGSSATATVLNRIFSSFQNLIRPLVPTICISRIFDISMT